MVHKQTPDAYIELRRKDYYTLVYDVLSKHLVQSVLDVGCATGDFVFQGPTTINWTGLDVSGQLLGIARKTRSRDNIVYIQGDIMNQDLGVDGDGYLLSYDAVSLLGTLSTIEDGVQAIRRCLARSNKLFIFQGALNPYGFDVLIGHRIAKEEGQDYMFSHNMLSVNTMKNVLSTEGFDVIHEEEYMPHARLVCEAESKTVKSFEISLGRKRALSNHLNMITTEFVVVAKRISP